MAAEAAKLSPKLEKDYEMVDSYAPTAYEKAGFRIDLRTATPAQAERFIALGAKCIRKKPTKADSTNTEKK